MKKSFKYYIVLLILKLKGIKKVFSQSPIDYLKLRQDDIQFPKGRFFKNKNVRTFEVLKSEVTEINQESDKLIIYIHGGAFVSGPSQHHWDTIQKIAQQTEQTIWFCNYPKAPENKISFISDNIFQIYELALQKFNPEKITIMGDSAGATLGILLTQKLIENKLKIPSKLVLISPVMDCSMENPFIINELETKDPMLHKKGVVSAKMMCSEDGNLKNPILSPLFGNFDGFPESYLFIGENDITFPDQKLLVQKLNDKNINSKVLVGKEMPHIWPLLPMMKESKMALNQIIELLN